MKTKFTSSLTTLLFALLLPLGLTACNTIKGMGQDISAGGEAIEETAKETKPY